MSARLAAVTALALALGACAAQDHEDEPAAAEAEIGLTRPSLPNVTAWAAGTNWKYETDFLGLRHAWVYTPNGFSKRAPGRRGVVFHLPGCGELPYQVAQGSAWAPVAEAHGLVVVVPEILSPVYPNPAAPNVACYDFGTVMQPTRYARDHAALIEAGTRIARDDLSLGIDPRQIYIGGLSAGGTVAMQVACMAPEIFSGVGSVAAPSLGTWQSMAVMPPVWSAPAIRWGCEYYANSSPAPDAKEKLGKQVYAIASDDNGLPAGIPIMIGGVWTATKFANQKIWDGDKYIPFAHHRLIADAMAPLFGAKMTGEDVGLPYHGTGWGCPGGEVSHHDTAETECEFSALQPRPWQVKADIWKDTKGRTRVVHLKQDGLRHRWPTGHKPPVTPSFEELVEKGYMSPFAEVYEAKAAGAPTGTFGIGFFGSIDTFDFTAYLADYFTANNPRLD
ncbi:MAG: alpha/beta hydrolase fold domain-containing protein [Labilithrix sp.]|nr:alpha/beta hydrolase fold domain-containing protein [Labilithrix sp.]MCW5810184.1 alpha/beta hydrolase fold domain-containing protein [Labilithrix sp.]